MSDFKMPALGADMEAGTLVEWHVKQGDRVKSGDVIAVVETQKGAIEVEVFFEGVVSNILVPVGARVPVGTILARIDGPAGETEQPAAAAARPPTPQAAAAPILHTKPVIAGARQKITPVARRRAAALSIEVTALRGTGVEGAIRLADVEAAAARAIPVGAPPIRRGVDLSEMRKAIADEEDIREAFDLDSMDFANLVVAIHKRTGVNIPEVDYRKLFTIGGAVAYVGKALGPSGSGG